MALTDTKLPHNFDPFLRVCGVAAGGTGGKVGSHNGRKG